VLLQVAGFGRLGGLRFTFVEAIRKGGGISAENVLPRSVASDGEKPRTEAGRLAQLAQRAEGLEKRLLQDIVEVGAAHFLRPRQGGDLSLVARDQELEGARRIGQRGLDERRVGTWEQGPGAHGAPS